MRSITRHVLLKDGEATNTYLYDNLSDGSPPFTQPATDVRFAAEGEYTNWKMALRRIIGTPTDWRIEMRFLSVLEETVGPENSAPLNYPMTPYEGEHMVLGNEGWYAPSQQAVAPGEWGVVATSADYTKTSGGNWNYDQTNNPGGLNPKTLIPITRIVRNLQFRHRVEFRVFSTGTVRFPVILYTETV